MREAEFLRNTAEDAKNNTNYSDISYISTRDFYDQANALEEKASTIENTLIENEITNLEPPNIIKFVYPEEYYKDETHIEELREEAEFLRNTAEYAKNNNSNMSYVSAEELRMRANILEKKALSIRNAIVEEEFKRELSDVAEFLDNSESQDSDTFKVFTNSNGANFDNNSNDKGLVDRILSRSSPYFGQEVRSSIDYDISKHGLVEKIEEFPTFDLIIYQDGYERQDSLKMAKNILENKDFVETFDWYTSVTSLFDSAFCNVNDKDDSPSGDGSDSQIGGRKGQHSPGGGGGLGGL
jgi:hypothetical protein